MTPSPPSDSSKFVAELLAEALCKEQEKPGVLVRDVPHLRPDAVLPQLAMLLAQDIDLRIAYLDQASANSARVSGIPDNIYSTRVEQAEIWRNTRNLDALIVVIAESDAAKLTSLEDFAPVGPDELRHLLIKRATVKFSEPNDVLPRWWEVIGSDDQISFLDLVDYYMALSNLEGVALRDKAALQINRLGLLPIRRSSTNPAKRNSGRASRTTELSLCA